MIPVRHQGARLFADVSLELTPATDRAGNPLASLAVRLLPGTVLDYKAGDGYVLLDEPATVLLQFCPYVLSRLAQRAQASRSGRSKMGPVCALRTMRAPRTRREP